MALKPKQQLKAEYCICFLNAPFSNQIITSFPFPLCKAIWFFIFILLLVDLKYDLAAKTYLAFVIVLSD